MSEVFTFGNPEQSQAMRLQALWVTYRTAQAKAERSGDIGDGIAAGKAWECWLSQFLSPKSLARKK